MELERQQAARGFQLEEQESVSELAPAQVSRPAILTAARMAAVHRNQRP
jgi:hypothetical protein